MHTILLIAAATLVSALAALIVAAVVRKAARTFAQRSNARIEQEARIRLLELVTDPTAPPPAGAASRRLRRCETRVAWELLRKFRGDARAPLVALLEQRGELERARRRTRHRGRVSRARAASLLGDAGDRGALPDLVRLLDDRDPEVRRIAVRSLGALREPAAVAPLLATVDSGRRISPTVVAEALMAIGASAHPALRRGLASPRAEQREIAATVLGLTGALEAADDLSGLLVFDAAAGVRTRAGEALGRIGLPGGVPALTDALRSAATAPERQAAAEALARIGDPSAGPALAAALDDVDHDVARLAASGLARLGEYDRLRRRPDSGPAREVLERLAAAPG